MEETVTSYLARGGKIRRIGDGKADEIIANPYYSTLRSGFSYETPRYSAVRKKRELDRLRKRIREQKKYKGK